MAANGLALDSGDSTMQKARLDYPKMFQPSLPQRFVIKRLCQNMFGRNSGCKLIMASPAEPAPGQKPLTTGAEWLYWIQIVRIDPKHLKITNLMNLSRCNCCCCCRKEGRITP